MNEPPGVTTGGAAGTMAGAAAAAAAAVTGMSLGETSLRVTKGSQFTLELTKPQRTGSVAGVAVVEAGRLNWSARE